MNPVIVRNVRIGEGIPKICVPIVGTTREEIIKEAEDITALKVDIVEWRADWFEGVLDLEKVIEMTHALRKILGETPILFTIRTHKEGGQREMDNSTYLALNKAVAACNEVDMLDVELFSGEEVVKELIAYAHQCGVRVIASNHDFERTPEKEEIIRRLVTMQELGADILKIAVMPNSADDVNTLLNATKDMCTHYAKRPIVTMSMSDMGKLSRISGEVFGSAITFGSAGKASAPGQISAKELRKVLEILHYC